MDDGGGLDGDGDGDRDGLDLMMMDYGDLVDDGG